MFDSQASRAEYAAPLGRVLLVDDDRSILRAYSRMLRDAGFAVVAISDACEVASQLAGISFDLVVSDLRLNGQTGLDVLRTVHNCDPDLPVVLMTAGSDLQPAVQAIEHGVMRYLLKPVPARTLSDAAREAVQRRRSAAVSRRALELYDGAASERRAHDDLALRFDSALEQLQMFYQPIVHCAEHHVAAYEALVRTREPSLARPDVLFEAAEKLGRVHELGRRIRESVAETITAMIPPCVFVNVHPADLEDEQLFWPDAPLSRVASRVVLEITERTSLDEIDDLQQRMAKLRALGYRIAIDDLGAGYAGLAAFAQIEPDVVKLDMSLVRCVDRQQTKRKVVESMTRLCRDLGAMVVAEGVETASERDTLREIGCDLLQGYLFAKPGPAFPQVSTSSLQPAGTAVVKTPGRA